MRDNGVIGLILVIYGSARDGFGKRRAWTVMAVLGLILALPVVAIVAIALLLLS